MRNTRIAFAALLTLVSGFVSGVAMAQVEETRHHRVPTVAGLPLKVLTKNGNIEIVRTETSEIVITAVARAKTKERLDQIKFAATSAPGVGSDIHVDFPDPEKGQEESCSLRIEMPTANGVVATTSNGGITCYGMSGVAEFSTSNGAIAVEKQDGPVNAKTSNGEVTVKLANAPTKVRTSNGRVMFTLLDLASAPFDLETSNGAVDVKLCPAYTGVIDIATTNGRITFPQTATIQKQSDPSKGQGWGSSSATISLGTGTENSRIRSTNGAVGIVVGTTAAEDAAKTAPSVSPSR